MKALIVSCGVVCAAALALVAPGASAPVAAPVAEEPAAVQPAGAQASYTWTRTDSAGKVVFTRTGTLTDKTTSFGGDEPASSSRTLPRLRIDACCSPSGCDAVDVVRNVNSWLSWQTLAKFHHRVYWCWSYPRITGVNVSCYASSVLGWMGVVYHGCGGGGSYYNWAGSGQGGHYSFRQGSFQQCAFGNCTTYRYPWIKVWVNGNGAWTQTQDG
jgi:hypothetical protein